MLVGSTTAIIFGVVLSRFCSRIFLMLHHGKFSWIINSNFHSILGDQLLLVRIDRHCAKELIMAILIYCCLENGLAQSFDFFVLFGKNFANFLLFFRYFVILRIRRS